MVGQWNILFASCCLNFLTTRAQSGLELSSIKVIQWIIIKMGYSMYSKYVIVVCNAIEITKAPKMQCFYAARLKLDDRRCAKIIDFHLTNYEYWNGAGHEPADDEMTVVVVLWVVLHILDPQNSIDFEYELTHRAIRLSSLGVVVRVMPGRGR